MMSVRVCHIFIIKDETSHHSFCCWCCFLKASSSCNATDNKDSFSKKKVQGKQTMSVRVCHIFIIKDETSHCSFCCWCCFSKASSSCNATDNKDSFSQKKKVQGKQMMSVKVCHIFIVVKVTSHPSFCHWCCFSKASSSCNATDNKKSFSQKKKVQGKQMSVRDCHIFIIIKEETSHRSFCCWLLFKRIVLLQCHRQRR